MDSEDNLWVVPSQLDSNLDLALIDPSDEASLRDYEAALSACQAASQLLWALSGRKFHTGTLATEHYVHENDFNESWSIRPFPGSYVADRFSVYLINKVNVQSNSIQLSGTPVKEIGSVTDLSDGRVLDPSEYTVINRHVLQFANSMPFKGVDVSYSYGQEPPALGRMAALQLARNFYYLWTDREDECDLPDRVTSVTRQGVSWVLMDNQEYINDLRTGIYVVDLFLRAVNPGKATQKAKVFSVDMPRGRRRSS